MTARKPESLIPSAGPAYAAARRAFTELVFESNRKAAMSHLDLVSGDPIGLKVSVVERMTSLAYAEADLGALLRTDMSVDDWVEATARWMLYVTGGSVDVDKAITSMLEAVLPEIDKLLVSRYTEILMTQTPGDPVAAHVWKTAVTALITAQKMGMATDPQKGMFDPDSRI